MFPSSNSMIIASLYCENHIESNLSVLCLEPNSDTAEGRLRWISCGPTLRWGRQGLGCFLNGQLAVSQERHLKDNEHFRDTVTVWWFGTFFIFPQYMGIVTPSDELIFFIRAQPPTSPTSSISATLWILSRVCLMFKKITGTLRSPMASSPSQHTRARTPVKRAEGGFFMWFYGISKDRRMWVKMKDR